MCISYFNEIINTLKNVDKKKLDNSHYIDRNVWFYSWLLQTQRGSVERASIYKLIGSQFIGLIDNVIDKAPHECITHMYTEGEDSEGVYVIGNDLAQAVKSFFDKEYQISSPIPDLGGMTGKQFIRRLNKLAPQPRGGLILPVASFLNSTLEARFQPVEDYLPPYTSRNNSYLTDIIETMRLVRSPKRFEKTPQKWQFLLSVFPSDGALSEVEVNRLCEILRTIAHEVNHRIEGECPILLFASSINAVYTTTALGRDTEIHYLWAFSALRLLEGIPLMVDKYGEEAIAAFPAIFMLQEQQTLSASKALENWESAITSKKN